MIHALASWKNYTKPQLFVVVVVSLYCAKLYSAKVSWFFV